MILNYVKRIHSSQPSGTGHILQREQPWKNDKVTSVNISQEDTTGDKARGKRHIQATDSKNSLILIGNTPVPSACFGQIQRTQVPQEKQKCLLLPGDAVAFPLLQRFGETHTSKPEGDCVCDLDALCFVFKTEGRT